TTTSSTAGTSTIAKALSLETCRGMARCVQLALSAIVRSGPLLVPAWFQRTRTHHDECDGRSGMLFGAVSGSVGMRPGASASVRIRISCSAATFLPPPVRRDLLPHLLPRHGD